MNLGKIEMTYKKILLSISGVPILSKSNSLIITAHGKTDSEQQWIMKHCQIVEFKKLMPFKNDVHPSDLGFFYEDEE